jgi:hypothetical protein
MISSSGRHLLWVALAAYATGAAAQTLGTPPREGAQAQACLRLETQLANVDRGISDPAHADQIRRYEDATGRQQGELDKTVSEARRMGCEGSSFFLFGGGQSQQCWGINDRIQRMRANLDRMMVELQRLQGSGSDRSEQRRAILSALADNDCGPQYRAAAPARPRGFFDSLFGGPGGAVGAAPSADTPGLPPSDLSQSSTYRTLCVRTCDGYYFPISFSTVPARFPDDERACQRMCPGTEVQLFTHHNPGEDVSHAVNLAGKPYTSLPTAFHYRQELTAACGCKRPDQSWADALGATGAPDTTVERGDIVVTDETSKAMAVPRPEATKPARQDTRRAKVDAKPDPGPAQAAPMQPQAAPTASANGPSGGQSVRSVGPQFLPAR